MFICKVTNEVNLSRLYVFPYRLVKHPFTVRLGKPGSVVERDPSLPFCTNHYDLQGDEIFAQTHKLDELGKVFQNRKLPVYEVNILIDSIRIELSTHEITKEWARIETAIENIFCLKIQ